MLGIGLGLTGRALCQGGAAPVCTITLNGDIAPAFGALPAEISGQTFSVTNASSTQLRAASTPTPQTITGTRVVEFQGTQSDGPSLTYFLTLPDFSKAITVSAIPSGGQILWAYQLQQPVGGTAQQFSVLGASPDTPAISIDSATGKVTPYLNGVQQGDAGAFDAAAATWFAGQSSFVLAGTIAPGAVGQNAAGTFVTDKVLFKHGYAVGDADWCGNEI